LLLMALLVSMVVGVGIGIGVQSYKLTPRQLMYIDFPGYLFMRMLKLLMLPLVTSPIIVALASLDIRSSGRIGGFAVGYFLTTTLLAVFLGIVLATSIRPGERGSSKSDIANVTEVSRISVTDDNILDLIRNVFPDNLVTAAFEQTETDYRELKDCKPGDTSLRCLKAEQILRGNETVFYQFSVSAHKGSPNILGLLAFCIAFGITLARMGERGQPLVDFFNALSEASLRLVGWVIWFSPIGVCSLIAAKVAEMDDLTIVVTKLGFHLLTTLVGLAIHGFVTLPLIYAVVVRMNPFAYMRRCLQALVTAFATSSSSATLPVTIRCVEENNRVDKRVSSFVLPVGATINMDGTAMYEAAAALFIAQLNGLTLSAGEIITTCLAATLASIGAAGVPTGGAVTTILVLNAVGLPDTDIAFLSTVDWLLDRFRTVINVWGDAVGAGIVQHLCRRQLQKAPPATERDVAERLDSVSSQTLHL